MRFCYAQAGPDGIVHVLMTAHDLSMRRADTVVRDLPGASHLLDLYTCKRVDKRKVCVCVSVCVCSRILCGQARGVCACVNVFARKRVDERKVCVCVCVNTSVFVCTCTIVWASVRCVREYVCFCVYMFNCVGKRKVSV